jgi:hypothetical protein
MIKTATREQLQALSLKDLTRVYIDALRETGATGVQLPSKRAPRVAWAKQVAAEIDRRRRK